MYGGTSTGTVAGVQLISGVRSVAAFPGTAGEMHGKVWERRGPASVNATTSSKFALALNCFMAGALGIYFGLSVRNCTRLTSQFYERYDDQWSIRIATDLQDIASGT